MIRKFGPDTVLLVIDPQIGVLDLDHWGGPEGSRNNRRCEERLGDLLAAFRQASVPVIFTRHSSREPASPLRPGQEGHNFLGGLEPRSGETIIDKDVNGAYIGTRLDLELRRAGIRRIVHAGMFTNMCVATTVRHSGNLGFDSYLAHDACFCCNRRAVDGTEYPAELVHAITVASLHGEFCTALPTDDIIGLVAADAPDLHRRQGNEPAN